MALRDSVQVIRVILLLLTVEAWFGLAARSTAAPGKLFSTAAPQ